MASAITLSLQRAGSMGLADTRYLAGFAQFVSMINHCGDNRKERREETEGEKDDKAE